MPPLLTPKLDLVFKLLFAQAPDILLDLVNTMLASPEHLHLRSLEVKNPTLLPEEELSKKFIVLDIQAVGLCPAGRLPSGSAFDGPSAAAHD